MGGVDGDPHGADGCVPLILVLFAAVGVVLIVAGVAWVFPPAGLVVAGVSVVAAAYLIAEEREK